MERKPQNIKPDNLSTLTYEDAVDFVEGLFVPGLSEEAGEDRPAPKRRFQLSVGQIKLSILCAGIGGMIVLLKWMIFN